MPGAVNGDLQEPLIRDQEEGVCRVEEAPPGLTGQGTQHLASWKAIVCALLSLQLGWGLWLLPADYARLGWCASVVLAVLALLTAYSGTLFTRLYLAVPGTVLFSDVGGAAAGALGRGLVMIIIYSLDATRCVILHLAATQSLRHIWPAAEQPPLWQCGAAVLVGAALLAQIRSMGEMSWVFITGTASQLVAIAIVVYDLVTAPDPDAHKEWIAVKSDEDSQIRAAVAIMNLIFAFGGQFAYTEVISSMKAPRGFSSAVLVATSIMGVVYAGLGITAYASRGDNITGIVIFDLPEGPRSRIAAACILVQACAQYLININVWVHNLLIIIGRWEGKGVGHGSARCSTDHCKYRWFWATLFVVSYSFALSVSLPFFSTLVGLVTASTYLICAYGLPAWFALKLLPKISIFEKALLWLLIPASLVLSGVGLWGSVKSLMNDLDAGGEGWGCYKDPLLGFTVPQ